MYRPQITLRKKIIKKKHKKWGHPLSWLVIGAGNSTSVYNCSKHRTSSPTKTKPHTAITTQPDESYMRKDSDRKEYFVTWQVHFSWNYWFIFLDITSQFGIKIKQNHAVGNYLLNHTTFTKTMSLSTYFFWMSCIMRRIMASLSARSILALSSSSCNFFSSKANRLASSSISCFFSAFLSCRMSSALSFFGVTSVSAEIQVIAHDAGYQNIFFHEMTWQNGLHFVDITKAFIVTENVLVFFKIACICLPFWMVEKIGSLCLAVDC